MQYKYETPKKLIKRILKYAVVVRKTGILDIETSLEKEKNIFLNMLLKDMIDAFEISTSGSYKRFIKYYIKELKCAKKEKYKIKKQLKMILTAALLIESGDNLFVLKKNLEAFYPRFKDFEKKKQKKIQLGELVRAWGPTEEDILYGKVSGFDDEMDLIFISSQKGELVVSEMQITDRFGKIKNIKKFIKNNKQIFSKKSIN